MKTIILFLLSSFFLTNFNVLLKNSNYNKISNNSITLTNCATKKTLNNVYAMYTVNKIVSIFGKPVSIEKETISDDSDGEAPWSNISYNGLKIELTGDYITDISISNKEWKINGIGIETPINEIYKKYKILKKEQPNTTIFKIPNFDGVLFIEQDKNKKVKKIGVSLS